VTLRLHRSGGYTPSEEHLEIVASNHLNATAGRVILYVHGAGGNNVIEGADVRRDLNLYANRGHVIGAALLGGATTWGNAASVSAIDAYLTYLNSTFGANVTYPWFIADSHGASIVLNWAVRNPTRLGAATLRVPAIALRRIHDSNVASLAANMETAYTNYAGLLAAYPTRDALHHEFIATYKASGIADRVRLEYNKADPIVARADVEEFAALTATPIRDMMGPSHDPWAYTDPLEQYDWFRGVTRG
jgi:hypothetical protein